MEFMTLDSSSSHSAAIKRSHSQTFANAAASNGTHVSGSDSASGAEMKLCAYDTTTALAHTDDSHIVWCYLFVHNQKVPFIEARLQQDGRRCFIHRTLRYVERHGDASGMKRVMQPSVSGLVFLQGTPAATQAYLNSRLPGYYLCKDCSTGRVAEIPNSQMIPFMRVAEADPDRIRFLMRPFRYYAENRTLLRITSGQFAGLEGYVIRIARGRRLVMQVGSMSIAISGIHAERFEEVDKNSATHREVAAFPKRNLHERNAFIDRYFHQISTPDDILPQTENIEALRHQLLGDVAASRLDVKAAIESLSFIIEEIAYYYAPVLTRFGSQLTPIINSGRQTLHDITHLIARLPSTNDLRQRCETAHEQLLATCGYLLE